MTSALILIVISIVVWAYAYIRNNRLEVRQFEPEPEPTQRHASAAPKYQTVARAHAPQPEGDIGTRFTLRGGERVRVDAVFEAWSGDDLDEMVAALGLPTHPVDRHHLLNCIVEAAYKRRQEPDMADLCARISETYLAEHPGLISALRKEMRGDLPSIPIFQQYATLLTELQRFNRAIEVCSLALDLGLHDGTQGGFAGRIARIERARETHLKKSSSAKVLVAPPRPQASSPPTSEPPPPQAWQETVLRGAEELDRLVSIGDWDSAREALQRISYGMVDASRDEKAAFTEAMCKFAARDPLLHRVMAVVLPLIEKAPGLVQSKLYPHVPDVSPELVRYVLYYAAELGQIERIKKGNSYALYAPGR